MLILGWEVLLSVATPYPRPSHSIEVHANPVVVVVLFLLPLTFFMHCLLVNFLIHMLILVQLYIIWYYVTYGKAITLSSRLCLNLPAVCSFMFEPPLFLIHINIMSYSFTNRSCIFFLVVSTLMSLYVLAVVFIQPNVSEAEVVIWVENREGRRTENPKLLSVSYGGSTTYAQ